MDQVWIIETREDLCAHGFWSIDSVWKEFKGGNKRLMEMVVEFPELDLRMRSWTLR